jgi:hypothetical protein
MWCFHSTPSGRTADKTRGLNPLAINI